LSIASRFLSGAGLLDGFASHLPTSCDAVLSAMASAFTVQADRSGRFCGYGGKGSIGSSSRTSGLILLLETVSDVSGYSQGVRQQVVERRLHSGVIYAQ
jgi:hypothetical protein